MTYEVGVSLLLFVAGEPGSGADPLQDVVTSVTRRVGAAVVGGWWMRSRDDPLAPTGQADGVPLEDRPWHLPPQQVLCVNLVLDLARKEGQVVSLIDVNRSAGDDELVRRWVGPDQVLPLLVRQDGSRIAGSEEFVPRYVRRFIRGR